MKAAARAAAILLGLALLSGCATLIERVVDAQTGKYFHDAGPPPAAPLRHELAKLPFSEYWTGIVFNGEKIGFTRFSVQAAAGEPRRYEIRSEASFLLRFLGLEKKVNLRSRDLVADDLTLLEFAYDYNMDGSEMRLAGARQGDELVATVVTGGRPTEQRLPLEGGIHPSSVIALYPVVHGLAPGREYGFRVYNGETQAIFDVAQRVTGYERSRFFEGNAFRIETRMRGQRVTTWIDHQGRPAFELALHGVMISALEDEARAKRYVALGSLNKKESLIDFSLIRPDAPIPEPRRVNALRVALSGVDQLPPSSEHQRCARAQGEVVCEISASGLAGADSGEAPQALAERYLRPSITVQSRDPAIRRLAEEIVAGSAGPEERIARIVRWLDANIEKAPLDVFSALDVLEKRKAECQGHAYLYTALARAAGIPTRIVNGLAYSEDLKGFLYHSWAQSLVEGRWVNVDPTFGQTLADATHIKLLEGETLADLVPLLDWVGKVKIRVLDFKHANQ